MHLRLVVERTVHLCAPACEKRPIRRPTRRPARSTLEKLTPFKVTPHTTLVGDPSEAKLPLTLGAPPAKGDSLGEEVLLRGGGM